MVIVLLNIDKEGRLYELDIGKMDFIPLIRIPGIYNKIDACVFLLLGPVLKKFYMNEYKPKSNIFSVKVPDNYLIEEDGATLSITEDGNGVGSVNLSAYVIPDTYNFYIGIELSDFMSSNKNANNAENLLAQLSADNYEEKEVVIEGQYYWKYWVLFKSNKAVFGTYNCNFSDRFVEKDIVRGIIDSIVILK